MHNDAILQRSAGGGRGDVLTAAERRRLTQAVRRLLPGAMVIGAGIGMGFSPDSSAATFQVTNLNDAGAGSLRDAIAQANGSAGADSITFQAGLTGSIALTSGELLLTDAVTITGPGPAQLTVNGSGASRVFNVINGMAQFTASISGLTITGGSSSLGAGVRLTDETLVLDNVVISGNSASLDGGGLWADGFAMGLTVQNSRISGNTAAGNGGGVYIEDTGAPIAFQNTVISGNSATRSGGGVYLYDPDTNVTFSDCTVSGNTSGSRGGGIYLYSPDSGVITVQSTTVSGNSAQRGGGLFFYHPDHPSSVVSSTISGNSATAGEGGGVYVFNQNGFGLQNSTVAGNSASAAGGGVILKNGASLPLRNMIIGDNTAGSNNDLDGSFDVGFSLIESPGSATLTGPGSNLLNVDAQLGALQNNGGATMTRKPASGSPVVNAGDPAFAAPPAVDQRGLARVTNGRIDMGAVEVAPGTVQFASATASVNEPSGPAALSVTRTGGSDGAISVGATTADGTALAGSDYTATTTTVNFADNDAAAKTLNVPIINDTAVEPNETFGVTLSGPTGSATLGAVTSATVTIVSDDVNPPGSVQLSVASTSVNEAAGTVTLTVSRGGGTGGAVSVDYATAGGSAVSGVDFTSSSGTLTWADGDGADKTIVVPIINDADYEPVETFTVTLSNPQGGAALGGLATTTVSILSDDNPNVPTLSMFGGLLLAALAGIGGLLGLRRRNSTSALALCLATAGLLAAGTAQAFERDSARHIDAGTLRQASVSGGNIHLVLSDGQVIDARLDQLRLVDRRDQSRVALTPDGLGSGMPVRVKQRFGKNGELLHVKVKVYDSAQQAAADAE